MAQIVNLTIARSIQKHWEDLNALNPYSSEFQDKLHQLALHSAFREKVVDTINNSLNVDNVDLMCYLVEEYYPDLIGLLIVKKPILYIKRRIENAKRYIEGDNLIEYIYAFPEMKYPPSDSRVQFLHSILDFVDLLDQEHQTITELIDSPLNQYEQMIQFISFYPHEKVALLLEKMSYVDKDDYITLTIKPIGQFKSPFSLNALQNLENYFTGKNEYGLKLVYKAMQKLAFNRPKIEV